MSGTSCGAGSKVSLTREEILAEIQRVEAELLDLSELRRGFLGQTGVHIGMRVLRQVTHQLDSEEVRLRGERERLLALLQGQGPLDKA